MSVALEQVPRPAPGQMSPQLLSQGGQDRHVPVAAALRVSDVDLGRVRRQVQVLDAQVDELGHPGPSVKQRLDHQSRAAGSTIGRLDQPLDLHPAEPIHGSPSLLGGRQPQFASRVLDDVLGLVVGEVVTNPQLDRLPHHLMQRVRVLDLTPKFSRFFPRFCPWHPSA